MTRSKGTLKEKEGREIDADGGKEGRREGEEGRYPGLAFVGPISNALLTSRDP